MTSRLQRFIDDGGNNGDNIISDSAAAMILGQLAEYKELHGFKNGTARAFCARKRGTACCIYEPDKDNPTWQRVNGYIVITDGSERQNIAPGLVFAVKIYDNTPRIYQFLPVDSNKHIMMKSYTARSICRVLKDADKWESFCITFDDMISCVTRYYPGIILPTEDKFFREFGCRCDSFTNGPRNSANLEDDE